jgi:hypothetical protein
MRRLLTVAAAVGTGAAILAAGASGEGSGRDIVGSWTPPPTANAHYVITNEIVGDGFEGKLTDSADIICSNAPHEGEMFWNGTQVGSDGTVPTFEGRTTIFQVDNDNNCSATNVKAAFWSPVDNRLRVCPNSASNAEADPTMDFSSDVGQSDRCTDFVRTEDPPTTQNVPHDANDYIGKITRDSNKCVKFGPVDYSFKLFRVEDDPIVRVDVYVKQKGQHSFHKYTDGGAEVNHFNTPPPGQDERVITLTWTHKKKAAVWKVRVKTQKKKAYARTRSFKACK